MRVLFVARWYPSHDSPGRGSFVADQVRALTRAGIEIVVASWEPELLSSTAAAASVSATLGHAVGRSTRILASPRSWAAGVPVARLATVVPSDPTARHPVDLAAWQAATLVPFAESLATTWPIDLIHAHTGLPDGVAAIAAANRLGVPLVTTEHDGSLDQRLADERSRAAYRGLVGERRRLVAVSERLAAQMADLSGVARSAIEVVPNLVDLGLFGPDPVIRRDPTELLWVGNRKASKGMPELLRAFAILAPGRPGLHLRLIGGAPTPDEEAGLRALADELGIASRVAFDPPAARHNVAAAMARAGLFVHPSPTESFGIVAVEALASGLPVVAVAPTVIDHIGRDGALGEAAAGPDAESLAAAIERALARPGDFDPAALRTAAAPFGETAVADRLQRMYREVSAGTRGGPAAVVRGDRSAAEPASAGQAGDTPPVNVLVVATRRRSAIERVGKLDPGAAAALVVVSAVATRGQHAGSAPLVGRWIEVDADLAFRAGLARLGLGVARPTPSRPRRWLGAALHPRRTVARRSLVAQRADLAAIAWTEAVAGAATTLAPDGPVIALDADDVAVVERAGLLDRLVPVGLRWIADRHDEEKS